MTQAEKIFTSKAEYNKWLKELTVDEKSLILDMINEALQQQPMIGSVYCTKNYQANIINNDLSQNKP